MNILITGGSGFLGTELLKIIPKKDKIFIFDLKEKKKIKSINLLKEVF